MIHENKNRKRNVESHIESCLRDSIGMMLEWEIGLKTGCKKSLGGHKGKYLETFLERNTWKKNAGMNFRMRKRIKY
ncbi:MAG: aminoglycoside 6-adenylyltransferase [Spirochaetales bacterium]|nr:aminoglycoside 6-adenylyltransferase [Spirochaetales bacterium]